MSYRENVESIAQEVIEENGIDEQNWHDAIHESVDGNAYIIYYAKNEEVLESSNNEPDPEEVAGMLSEKQQRDWRAVRTMAAFLAMEQDVYQECRNIVEEYFECENCNKVCRQDEHKEPLCTSCCKEALDQEDMERKE